MRALHYPPQTSSDDDLIVGFGASTDFQCFTIFRCSSHSGVKLGDSTMDKCTANSVNIGHLEGIQIAQLIVPSIGDQFARWTMCCFMHTDDITLFRQY